MPCRGALWRLGWQLFLLKKLGFRGGLNSSIVITIGYAAKKYASQHCFPLNILVFLKSYLWCNHMEILTLALGAIGGFIAGIFVVSDKNRHALYQAKLESHKKLSYAIATATVCGLGVDKDEVFRKYQEEAILSLSQLLLSENIFLPKGMVELLTDFISLPLDSYRESDLPQKMLTLLRNDLGVRGLEFINHIASLSPAIRHKVLVAEQ